MHTAPKILICESAIDPSGLLMRFTKDAGNVGAIASFTGLVRADKKTQSLALSHYPEFTENIISSFAAAARDRFDLIDYMIHHRVGQMAVGEPIVFVATASVHRRGAFAACDYLMDMLKSEAPFWKQEITAGAAQWIEPRDADFTDKKRWT